MKTDVMGVPVDNVTFAEALEFLEACVSGNGHKRVMTPNPEMVMAARRDEDFLAVLKRADLVVADGVGVVIASRFTSAPLKERVAGCDLVQALFATAARRPLTAYFLGGKPGVAEAAKANAEKNYPGLFVAGTHDGYFGAEAEKLILADIMKKKPDVLLVGLGFPKQEKWMDKNRDLPVKLSMGIGGTLDVLAGTVKRAPALFQRLGLEWLYRLIMQPSRFSRMMVLPKFLILAFCERGKRVEP